MLGPFPSLPHLAHHRDKTAIDVRRIDVLAASDNSPPAWSITQEGCGGGQFSRDYLALLRQSSTTVLLVEGEPEEPSPAMFDPFSVSPGESVYMDYALSVCEPITTTVQFRVTYKADSAEEQTITVPQEGIMMSGLSARRAYMSSEGEILETPRQTPSPSADCNLG